LILVKRKKLVPFPDLPLTPHNKGIQSEQALGAFNNTLLFEAGSTGGQDFQIRDGRSK